MSGIALIRTETISLLNSCVSIPLGVHQLASVLARRGYAVVDILDMQIYRPEEIRRRFDAIVAARPDVIGLSAVSQYRPLVKQVTRFFKRRLPETTIVLGGPLVSSNPESLGELPDADFGIAGEGEEALPAFLDALAAGRGFEEVPGLVRRTAQGLACNPPRILSFPLDDLPPIDWDRVDFRRYGKFISMNFRRSPYAAVMTSRGCPFQCIYCHKMFGNKFRARSVDHVMDELHWLYTHYSIRRFEINDDIFNWDYGRAVEILTRIRDELPEARIGFGNGLRADRIDEPLIRLLKEVNCTFLGIPVESASPRIQKLIRKNLDLEKIGEVVRLARKHRLHTWGIFMIGFPSETQEEVERTIRYAEEMDVDFVAIQAVNPYEGTELRKMINEAAPSEMGNIHKSFFGGEIDWDAVNNRKLKVMRARMFRPANWYYVWNVVAWRLWWMRPRQVLRHLFGLVRETLSRRKVFTSDGLEKERDEIARELFSSLD